MGQAFEVVWKVAPEIRALRGLAELQTVSQWYGTRAEAEAFAKLLRETFCYLDESDIEFVVVGDLE